MVSKILLSSFLIIFPFLGALSQFVANSLQNLPTQEIDSNFVNMEENTFSIRAFTVLKSQSFKLSNEDYGLRYTPNNRFGVGIGFAYYPILLDFAINIKVYKENASERMDIQGELLYKRSLFTLYFQDYNGFNITGDQLHEPEFRSDIKSMALGISYLRVLNAQKMSFRSVLSGGAEQKKSVGSFAIGGSVNLNRMKADSSIIPSSQNEYFNEYAMITRLQGFSISARGGYSHVFVLGKGFFIFSGLFPGIGIAPNEITSIETFIPSNWLSLSLDFQVSFGYNGSKIYSTIGLVTHNSIRSMDYSNRLSRRLGRIKWVLGFKL